MSSPFCRNPRNPFFQIQILYYPSISDSTSVVNRQKKENGKFTNSPAKGTRFSTVSYVLKEGCGDSENGMACSAARVNISVGPHGKANMSMNRLQTNIKRLKDDRNDGFVPGTPAERLALVWPLTKEALSLDKRYDVEQRLQRHVTRLIRRKG